MDLKTPAKEFHNVQVDDSENMVVMEIDNQSLGDDFVAYFGFLMLVVCFVLVGLFGPPTTNVNIQTIPKVQSSDWNTFNTSLELLTPLAHQLLISVAGTSVKEDVKAKCVFSTKQRNITKSIHLSLQPDRFYPLFHTHVLNFTSFKVVCAYKGTSQTLKIRTETETPMFATAKIWTIIFLSFFWTGLLLFRAITPRRKFREVQIHTMVLIVMTIVYDNPLMPLYYKSPRSGMLVFDKALKQLYYAYLMYYGIVVFRHLQMRHKISDFEKAAPYYSLVYGIVSVSASVLSPPKCTFYGQRVFDLGWIDVVVGAVVLFYFLVFIINLSVAHEHMEASGSYAFNSYIGLSIAYVSLLAIGKLCTRYFEDMSISFTFSMATVNAFALLMDRAHSEAGDDEFFYENPSSASEDAELQADVHTDNATLPSE